MPFIIQDMESGVYARHNGKEQTGVEHMFIYTGDRERATEYPSLEHAGYVAFWNLEYWRKWRIINTETGKSFVHDCGPRFVPEKEDGVHIGYTCPMADIHAIWMENR